MVNEDILTALRNAIERGESLETASRILINSGYNAKEVQEASKFIGSGSVLMQEPKPDENLIMPSKKSFFPFSRQKTATPVNSAKPVPIKNEIQQIKQKVSDIPLSTQPYKNYSDYLTQIPTQKKSYTKEIILVIVLLVLIGVLIVTLWFKQPIIEFFSKM